MIDGMLWPWINFIVLKALSISFIRSSIGPDTRGGGGGGGGCQCHWDVYHIRENQFPQSTLNGDLIPGHKDTQNGDNGPFCIYITP